jgi:hypothetical protein
MNHQIRTHLNRILNEDDNKYIENCVNKIQRGVDPETEEGLVKEVLRYIPPQEPQRREGFLAQLEASRGVQNTPTSENAEPEPRPKSEFIRMLEASSKSTTKREQPILKTATMTGVLRQVDESQFPDLCNPMSCPDDFARHCGANREDHYGQPCIYKTPKNR